MAKSIMIQGTMSNAGKSLIAAGLCRIFKQDGYKVAPFKSQNMALNSYVTNEGLEMGRAQVVQAMAAGVEPSVRMNPILLKPTTDMGSQVIVQGQVVGNMRAMDYFAKKKEYIPVIRESYEQLAADHDIIVIEGAGSPAEINLKQDDIVNMGMARIADAPVLLVADIDRGGVFAQLIGTVMLLEPEEQARIKGLIVNKFRGDKKILDPGITMLEERAGKPVLGVVPYADVDIEDEDSLASSLAETHVQAEIDVAVIRFPRISNFTDMQALSMERDVSVRYVTKPSELGEPDAILLPGTKNTIQDLLWLRESGLEAKITRLAKKGTIVFGICGGYQMLGGLLMDPFQTESALGSVRGMGLLPVTTVFEEEKKLENRIYRIGMLEGDFASLSGKKVVGYEIHMGRTEAAGSDASSQQFDTKTFGDNSVCTRKAINKISPFVQDSTGNLLGCTAGTVAGSYIHGIFDEVDFREAFINLLYARKGKIRGESENLTLQEYREQQFDKLAQILRESLDMEKIYEILGLCK
ncbi:cobyric acid synthase [Eubacterium sp. MSJ-33]|uniref:cobyric acid synthase n=1 Tax=Eubacterium sp. MSJ-33 TaxID=2841528 RepID=UPI001C77C938|nr:cobyric acid synthase [Eubacterium sp. MSJ-33]QWT52484.1 cobyric acid synthase [Eubacterium sp. MSJ-33]